MLVSHDLVYLKSRCIIAPVQAVKGCKHKGIQLHKKMNI